jgi:hypothetical protein
MGDLVLLPTEVGAVMNKLEGGIEITALHNHLLRNEPVTMYMYFMGHGDPTKLAGTLHTALLESKTPLPTEHPPTLPPNRRIEHRPGYRRDLQGARTPGQGQRRRLSDDHSTHRQGS